MTYDIADLFARHERDRYMLHIRHLDEQMVKVLKTIGYDVGFWCSEASCHSSG